MKGVELGLEALTIVARMNLLPDVEEVESGQAGGRVGDRVVTRMGGFDEKIALLTEPY